MRIKFDLEVLERLLPEVIQRYGRIEYFQPRRLRPTSTREFAQLAVCVEITPCWITEL